MARNRRFLRSSIATCSVWYQLICNWKWTILVLFFNRKTYGIFQLLFALGNEKTFCTLTYFIKIILQIKPKGSLVAGCSVLCFCLFLCFFQFSHLNNLLLWRRNVHSHLNISFSFVINKLETVGQFWGFIIDYKMLVAYKIFIQELSTLNFVRWSQIYSLLLGRERNFN